MAHLDTNLIVLISFIFGIYLFGQGFLLNRKELNNVNKQTSLSPSYNGAIIIIIDALKFDFIDPRLNKTSGHWAGNLESVQYYLNKYPNSARLFHFEADPPTTTLQRLKGLTVGSFPTFIDASANFGGSSITEDNLLSQFAHAGKTVALYGDDTWLSLFPNHFTSSRPYESFNIMDLDTVDAGIRSHLSKHWRKEVQWSDITIVHFLGVDHCGHRYGQNHPEMRRKLMEMDEVIRQVIDDLDDDKLLVVMGDHGMTANGDHGGDAPSEVDAGLFLFSKKGFTPTLSDRKDFPRIHQIDLVPTLSLLLGIPIPFSNLGQTSATFFQNVSVARLAMRENVQQIWNYLKQYQSKFRDLPDGEMQYIKREYVKIVEQEHSDVLAYINEVSQLLSYIKAMCRHKWTAFDLYCVTVGLIMMLASLINLSPWVYYRLSRKTLLFLIFSGVPALLKVSPLLAMFLPTLFVLWFIVSVYCHSGIFKDIFSASYLSLICSSLFVGSCCIFFSNSFIIHENLSLNYVIQSILFVALVRNLKIHLEKCKSEKRLKSTVMFQILLPYLVAAISLRCANFFTICREEQGPSCIAENMTRPMNSLSNEFRSFKSWRCGISTITIVTIGFLHFKWLQKRGNLTGYRPAIFISNYILPVITLGSVVNNFIECYRTSKTDIMMAGLSVLPIRISFALGLVSFVIICIKPLMVSVDKRKPVLPVDDYRIYPRTVVPFLWKHLKDEFNTSKNAPKKVCGERTVFSSTFSVTFWLQCIVFVPLLGDGFLYPFILIFIMLLSISLVFQRSSVNDQDLLVGITLSLLSHYLFYCLGHQPTLSNIPWYAAFVGFRGGHSNHILPGLFILLNIFSSFIVTSFLLPLTITSEYTPELRFFSVSNDAFTHKGEEMVFENMETTDKNGDYLTQLRRRYRTYIFFACIMATSSMLSAAHFRRHLMVWKIFAPRMMYAVLSLGGTFLGSCVGYVLAKSIHAEFHKLKNADIAIR